MISTLCAKLFQISNMANTFVLSNGVTINVIVISVCKLLFRPQVVSEVAKTTFLPFRGLITNKLITQGKWFAYSENKLVLKF